MSGFSNTILLMLCIAFVFMLAAPSLTDPNGSPNTAGSFNATFTKIAVIDSQLNSTSIVIPNNVPIAGGAIFPNPFAIFSTVANLFLSLGSIVTDTLGSLVQLPDPVFIFLSSILLFITLIKVVSWWKGNDPS